MDFLKIKPTFCIYFYNIKMGFVHICMGMKLFQNLMYFTCIYIYI